MGRIYNSIVETVGRTPLVRLNNVTAGLPATIALKCEFFNPLGSVKDRIGIAMIEDAEQRGSLRKRRSSSNRPAETPASPWPLSPPPKATSSSSPCPRPCARTPDTACHARSQACPDPGAEGMKGAIARAEQILKETPNTWMPQQFNNAANPAIHQKTTGEEIGRTPMAN